MCTVLFYSKYQQWLEGFTSIFTKVKLLKNSTTMNSNKSTKFKYILVSSIQNRKFLRSIIYHRSQSANNETVTGCEA